MLKINKIYLIILVLVYIEIPIIYASDIIIQRYVPEKVTVNSIIEIKIIIINNGNEEKNIIVHEIVGDFDPIEPYPIIPVINENDPIAVPPAHYEWKFNLSGNSEKNISYKVLATTPGKKILPPTVVYANGEVIYGESQTIKVECNKNDECESNENYLNCPEDCPSGSSDGICDLMQDGICDPDCEKNADPDCITTTTLSTTTTTIPSERRSKVIWYIIIGIIIAILVFFFIYQMRNQPQQHQQISY